MREYRVMQHDCRQREVEQARCQSSLQVQVATLPDIYQIFQNQFLWLLLAGLVLSMTMAVPVRAERVFLDDGTVIDGELVGYEGGNYKIKMGRFVKIIPDSRITDIKASESGSDVRPAASAGSNPQPVPRSRTFEGMGAGSAGAGQNPDDVLRSALGDAGISDPDAISKSDAVQQTMNMLLGGRSSVSESDMEEINQSPQVQKLMKTYTDPNYQRSLIEAAEAMQQELAPGEENPHIETLKSLFDQLNGTSGSR